jgi:hypothetical protein
MSVEEFNRLNSDKGNQLRVDDTDWIGVNSPVVLRMRYKGEVIEFPTTARGGGIQIQSGGGELYGTPMQVQSLSFDIGPTYGSVKDVAPMLTDLCDRLHAAAGTKDAAGSEFVPQANEISNRLRNEPGDLRHVTVCHGESEDLVFGITAGHYMRASPHGGDLTMIFVDGHLALPFDVLMRRTF